MVLPYPVLSDDDIKVAIEVIHNPSSPIRNTWNKDPTKLTVLRAMASCQTRLGCDGDTFDANIVDALAQKPVCSFHSYSSEVEGSALINCFQVPLYLSSILRSLS